MALESMKSYPKGSAEYAATYLTTRGLSCLHPAKYHADGTDWVNSKYPSRLGFFHFTAEEPKVSFLDTRKLCNACLDLVVPNGFNFWSAYSSVNGASTADHQAPKLRWLNMTPSSNNYPPLVQAGTEGFAHASLQMEGLPTRLTTPPVVLPIPKVPGAKEAWDWLQIERKPFYIDQLHLVKGWSLIVERTGIGYHPEAQPGPKGQKSNSSGRGIALLEKGLGNPTSTPPKAKNKTKVAKDKPSALSTIAESSGSVASLSIIAVDQPGYGFESLKPNQSEQYTSLVQSSPSNASRVSTKAESTEKSIKKSSSKTKTSKTAEQKTMNTTSVGEASLGGCKKALKLTFTRNWCDHDLIPFDNPTVPLKLSDYKRQAQTTARPIIDPQSNYSPEKLIRGLRSIEDSISPGQLIETPDMVAFLRASGIGESKTRVSRSTSKEKGTRKASPEGSTTKTKKTKSEHDLPFEGKAHKKQSTNDKPLMTGKTPIKQRSVANESIQSTPKKDSEKDTKKDSKKGTEKDTKKDAEKDTKKDIKKDTNKDPKNDTKKDPKKDFQEEPKARSKELKGDGPRRVEPTKAPKTRLSQQNEGLAGLGFKHKPKPNFGNMKPMHLTREVRSGGKEVSSGGKSSFSHKADHSESSKAETINSSKTETININHHHGEAASTGVSVNNASTIDQQPPIEDTSRSSDDSDTSDHDNDDNDDGEEEEEEGTDHTSSDNDDSGDGNDQDSDPDSDSSDHSSGGNDTDSDSDDSDGNDGNDTDGDGSDGSDAADSDHGESDGSSSDGSGVHSDGSDSDSSAGDDDNDDNGDGDSNASDGGGDDDNSDSDANDRSSDSDSDDDGNRSENSENRGDSDSDD